jgi:hypothetical protein
VRAADDEEACEEDGVEEIPAFGRELELRAGACEAAGEDGEGASGGVGAAGVADGGGGVGGEGEGGGDAGGCFGPGYPW